MHEKPSSYIDDKLRRLCAMALFLKNREYLINYSNNLFQFLMESVLEEIDR